MKDAFDIYAWNKKRYLVEDIEEDLNEELPSISDLLAKNDLRVEAVAKAISEAYDIVNDGRLKGKIRMALADHIYESDDPTIGAEEEGDPNEYVVGEGFNDRVVNAKLSDLNYDFLTSYFENERFNAPNPDDSSRTIYSVGQWEDWKDGIMNRFGDVDIELDNSLNSFEQFKIIDKDFLDDAESYIRAKGEYLDNLRSQGINYGLD
tara:strand:- start:1001 stop:1618 length:618 start_codon:yes stop_codon:yes gene_type:complete